MDQRDLPATFSRNLVNCLGIIAHNNIGSETDLETKMLLLMWLPHLILALFRPEIWPLKQLNNI